jgi:hypothetical protein
MEPFLPLKGGTFSTRLFRPQVVHFDRPLTDNGATWGEPLVLTGADIQVDLGYPSTVELDDGTLLSACYEWQPQTRHAAIRQITWKLPQQNAASKKIALPVYPSERRAPEGAGCFAVCGHAAGGPPCVRSVTQRRPARRGRFLRRP